MNTSNNEGLSIIVPFLNEEDGIELFCSTLDDYSTQLSFPIELVFVDDGSTDRSVDVLNNYSFKNIKRAQLVKFSRNFGSHAAIRAGLQYAYYPVCTWLGSDLQEPLELLGQSYELIKEGYDAVYVSKKSIVVSRMTRAFSKTYSHLMRKYAVSNYSSDGVSTIVFNNKIKDLLNSNVEGNSSIMLQIIDAGFKTANLEMDFHERSTGKSKWTFSKKVKLMIDSFVSFSFAPIRMVSIIGIIMFLIGIVIGIVTIINRLLNFDVPVGYSTLASMMALGFGITNISLGIIAEYLWRAYDAARNRPVYIVDKTIPLAGPEVQTDEEISGSADESE